MEQQSFKGQSFLEKKAFNMESFANSLKTIGRRVHPSGPVNVVKNAVQPGMGKFVLTPQESAINPENLHLFNPEEVNHEARNEAAKESSGSFLTDGILGLTKKVAPKTKEPINNAKASFKQGVENIDTKMGSLIAGKNPESLWGKLWSTPVQRHVGNEVDENGITSRVMKENRRPSFLAPVTNTLKVGTPLLAAAYVGEKLYPAGENPNANQQINVQNGMQAPYENNLPKQANEIFDTNLFNEMDKIASIQKIAELEENLSKYASQLEEVGMEKTAIEKRLKETEEEKAYFEKRASEIQEDLMEKEAAFEELRLRTIAQKRSKVAVDLAEQMLSVGLIKQAELADMTDDLMECDESTIKRYNNMVKSASSQEESLESLAILGEYKGNEKLAASNRDLAKQGLSKNGQSIGDAVRDLNIK